MDPALSDYVIKARQVGGTDEMIRTALLKMGWNVKLVEEALAAGNPTAQKPVDTVTPTPVIPAATTSAAPVTTQTGATNVPIAQTVARTEPTVEPRVIDSAQAAVSQEALKNISGTGQVSSVTPNMSTIKATDKPKKPFNKKGLIIGLSIFAALAIIGSVSYWYYATQYAPKKLLIDSVSNAITNKSLEYTVNVVPQLGSKGSALAANAGLQANNTLTLKISGGYNFTATNASNGSDISLLSIDNQTSSASSSKILGLALVAIGDTTYLNLSANSQIQGLFGDTDTLTNTWWSTKTTSLAGSAGKTGSIKSQDNSSLVDTYTKNSFLVSQKNLGRESVGGVNTQHYKLTIDKEKLSSFISAEAGALGANNTTSTASINRALSTLTDFEIWIDPKTKQIVRFVLQNDLSPYGTGTTDYVQNLTTTGSITNQNGNVLISAPSTSKPLPDLGTLY